MKPVSLLGLTVLLASLAGGSTLGFKEILIQSAPETDGAPLGPGESVVQAIRQLADYRRTALINCEASRFYTISGKCNNLLHPLWGSAFQPFVRELRNKYEDGKVIPRLYAKGKDKKLLPSARTVSTRCLKSLFRARPRDLHPNHNQNLMQFGQYFAHDTGLTPVMEGFNCCKSLDKNGLHPDTFNGGPCFPIIIEDNDRRFSQCMVFNRSLHELDSSGVAQQFTATTHFVDQSTVYGSTEKFALSIRTFKNGKLRTDKFGMLPQDNTQKCVLKHPLDGCPVAGDNRLSVFPGLTVTHLIFHLEHNRVASALRKVHPRWTDERLYQEARAIVIAETQNLVYKEYLPVVLGKHVVRFFGLLRPASYDPNLNPGVINSFQTAAFRFGHSQINNFFLLNPVSGTEEELKDVFFRPDKLFNPVNDEPIFKYLMQSLLNRTSLRVDNKLAEGVVDFLFLNVDAPGHSTDLPARNIQRGRDHGLPPYLDFLDKALQVFGDKKFIKKIKLPDCISGLYRSVRDVDLFLGGLFEDHVKDGVVGPVFAYLMGKQFKNLREGDRLFFDTTGSQAGFSKAQITNIKQTSYSGIICRNTGLKTIQKKPFHIPHNRRNPVVDCDSIPDIDFSLW